MRSKMRKNKSVLNLVILALALGVLVGLAANALFGWWWADPVAALLVAVAAARPFEPAAPTIFSGWGPLGTGGRHLRRPARM